MFWLAEAFFGTHHQSLPFIAAPPSTQTLPSANELSVHNTMLLTKLTIIPSLLILVGSTEYRGAHAPPKPWPTSPGFITNNLHIPTIAIGSGSPHSKPGSRFYGLTVMTADSDSASEGSTPSRTFFCIFGYVVRVCRMALRSGWKPRQGCCAV